jgi:hypothetical protein
MSFSKKPNPPRDLDDLTGDAPKKRQPPEERVQLNVTVPASVRKAMHLRKIETEEELSEQATQALKAYLGIG